MSTLPPVLILAGGLGTRISKKYPNLPKFLIPICDEPFGVHQLRQLKRMGFENIIICIGHQGQLIQQSIGNGYRFGLSIKYSTDNQAGLLGTGGAIQNALHSTINDFGVIYGDSYLDFDAFDAYEKFKSRGKKGLMTVLHNKNQGDKSNIIINNNDVSYYSKSNPLKIMEYIDYGFSYFSKSAFENQALPPYDLSQVFKELIKQNQLSAYEVQKKFYEVGSLSGISEFRDYISRNNT